MMNDNTIVTGTKEEVERKIRILKTCIKNAKAKKDLRLVESYKQSLKNHEEYLRRMK